MKIVSTEISDGASRRTTSCSGNVKLEYPIPNLPIPKFQLGNFLLVVNEIEISLQDKEELAKKWANEVNLKIKINLKLITKKKKNIPDVTCYSKAERHKQTNLHFGFSMLFPLVKKEPNTEAFGFGHADNCIYRKMSVKLFELALQYGNEVEVSKFFFGNNFFFFF